jgi:hypothetical protein
VRRCYNCKSSDHVVANCPYNSDNDEDEKKKHKKDKTEKKEKKEKKMAFHKKKGGENVVTWDSDGSSDIDGFSDDDNKSIKKALASIAINDKLSIFNTPSTCLMAKTTKVKYDESDVDSDSDDYRSDDDEEYIKEELLDMCEQVHTCFEKKRKECKELLKRIKSLEQSFDELNAFHESLKEDHEELGKAHTKLKKVHSSLLEQVKKEETKKEKVIVTCDVGLTCDILDESFYKPIVVAPTNPLCSITTSTSPFSDGFTCDASLMVENETLKNEVNELTRALGNAYGGDARLLKCLGSQRFSHNKEGLGYTPKKGKVAFITPKASFVKGNCRFCNRCKQVGHIEQHFKTTKNKQPHVSSIRFDSCYMLVKGTNGVKAKFIGTPIVGQKKKAIWVPKTLVTNL